MAFFKDMGKGLSRTTHKMAVAVGRAKETKDESFESTKASFKSFETSVGKVQKAAKAYQAALGAFHKAQQAFAMEMLALYTEHGASSTDEPDLSNLVQQSRAIVDQLESGKDRIYGGEYERRVVEPLNKYVTDLKEVDRRINLRASKVVDMDRYNRKLAGIDQAKHPEEYLREQSKSRQTTDEYQAINAALIHDLPVVMNQRNLVLNSVFASSVNLTNEYYATSAQIMGGFAPQVGFVNVEGGISYSLVAYLSPLDVIHPSTGSSHTPTPTPTPTPAASTPAPYAAPAPSPYGAPAPYNPPPAAGGYAPPPAAGGYAPPPAAGGYAPPPAAGGYAPPPAAGGYAPPQAGFAPPPGRVGPPGRGGPAARGAAPMPPPGRGPPGRPAPPPQVRQARALYAFAAEDSTELPLQPGDIITIIKANPGDEWIEGELNGHRGLLPASYVQML